MKNRYEIDARKSDAKMRENERKWSPNGSQNPVKIEKSAIKNEVLKNIKKTIKSIKNLPPPNPAFGYAKGTCKVTFSGRKPTKKENLLGR